MDYEEIGIKVYLADCNGKYQKFKFQIFLNVIYFNIYLDAIIQKFKLMEKELCKKKNEKYVDDSLLKMTIHDAVISAIKKLKKL